MSQCILYTACVEGSEVLEVTVEVDIQRGLPLFTVIGLPDKRIDEARERVRTAIKNSGYTFPLGKITVNLAPSSVRKRGTGFDLAIALAILIASGAIENNLNKAWVIGELGLNGEVRPYVHLASVLITAKAKNTRCMLPSIQENVAGLVGDLSFAAVKNLADAAQKVTAPRWSKITQGYNTERLAQTAYLLDKIQGQEQGKRALLIALAGRHHLVLTGPPGVGKTLLAEAARELLPPLARHELLELMQLYAYAEQDWNTGRPFRVPPHSVTKVGLFGGGTPLRPGEASLAHHGILFLDEFPLYSREVLEDLRTVLTNYQVTHNRSGKRHIFPAHFIMLAARNPCACGKTGVEGQECLCTAAEQAKYAARLSEPLLDRCALFCDVPTMRSMEWNGDVVKLGDNFRQKIERVWNSDESVMWSKNAHHLLSQAIDALHLSGRGRTAVCAVAETIAKLDESRRVDSKYVSEALQYRRR